MSQPLPQTDGSTPVSAALTPQASPVVSNVADTGVNAALGAMYEQRNRDLMSAKDKALNELSLAQQAAIRAQQERDALQQDYSHKLQGATDATANLMAENARLTAEKDQVVTERDQQRALTLKLQALATHPELLPYADFIPVTADEAQLAQAIAKFTEIRSADLAKVTPPSTPQAAPMPPSLQGIYSASAQTPTSPPTTPPQTFAPTDLGAATESLNTRFAQLYSNPTAPDFEPRRQALIAEAGQLAKQQFGA